MLSSFVGCIKNIKKITQRLQLGTESARKTGERARKDSLLAAADATTLRLLLRRRCWCWKAAVAAGKAAATEPRLLLLLTMAPEVAEREARARRAIAEGGGKEERGEGWGRESESEREGRGFDRPFFLCSLPLLSHFLPKKKKTLGGAKVRGKLSPGWSACTQALCPTIASLCSPSGEIATREDEGGRARRGEQSSTSAAAVARLLAFSLHLAAARSLALRAFFGGFLRSSRSFSL